jgi:hypothetical protein
MAARRIFSGSAPQRSANSTNVAYYNAHESELNAIVHLMMALGAVEEVDTN